MEHAAHYVDILNRGGEVVGKKLRRDINKLTDIHHAVHTMLITPQGKIVLGSIPMREDLHNLYPKKLGTTIATIRRTGETAKQAAVRSLSRELFIDKGDVKLLGEKMFKLPKRLNYITAYYIVADTPESYSILDIDALTAVTSGEFQKMLNDKPDSIAPTLKAIWEEFRNRLPI